MKYLRFFENSQIIEDDKYHIGDFVICKETNRVGSNDPEIYNFFNFIDNNIGKIVDTDAAGFDYIVKYKKIPKNIQNYFYRKNNTSRGMSESEILYHSKNKEELETILFSKKYNI